MNNREMKYKLTLVSWNVKSYKLNCHWINEYLCNTYDIIMLQETWLQDFEENLVCNLNENYCATSVSTMKSDKKIVGRPFGGTSILWKKELSDNITVVSLNDNRMSAIKMNNNGNETLIINCYFPTSDKVLLALC